MLKKKFLLSLIIFQGVLIVIAIIAIIIGVFYKYDNDKNLKDISLTDLHIDDISLLDEEHYQYKIIEENKIIFQIIDIENNKIKREIIIEK
ncbi:hypothetical protein HIMB59_00000270 [alpha proteobacterium HIMB59]|jgi:hypothetical protein|nr:hypothetical protein HIMB59_00000270 [alpha proteobacterium HIMB59]